MKRILCLLCILALAAGLLAACGRKAPPPSVDEDITTAADNNIDTPEDLEDALNQFNQMFSATWPENEFTKQVPAPKFEVGLGTVNETEYVVLCGATIPELKDYVKDLKRAGFTKNADTTDTSALGMTVYSYSANNSRGYRVEINNAMGMSTITIKRAN